MQYLSKYGHIFQNVNFFHVLQFFHRILQYTSDVLEFYARCVHLWCLLECYAMKNMVKKIKYLISDAIYIYIVEYCKYNQILCYNIITFNFAYSTEGFYHTILL